MFDNEHCVRFQDEMPCAAFVRFTTAKNSFAREDARVRRITDSYRKNSRSMRIHPARRDVSLLFSVGERRSAHSEIDFLTSDTFLQFGRIPVAHNLDRVARMIQQTNLFGRKNDLGSCDILRQPNGFRSSGYQRNPRFPSEQPSQGDLRGSRSFTGRE